MSLIIIIIIKALEFNLLFCALDMMATMLKMMVKNKTQQN